MIEKNRKRKKKRKIKSQSNEVINMNKIICHMPSPAQHMFPGTSDISSKLDFSESSRAACHIEKNKTIKDKK